MTEPNDDLEARRKRHEAWVEEHTTPDVLAFELSRGGLRNPRLVNDVWTAADIAGNRHPIQDCDIANARHRLGWPPMNA